MNLADTLTCQVEPNSIGPESLSCKMPTVESVDFWAALTPQILWTSGTALFVALFTTVIAQYLFAPWLEVRKQILIDRALERSKVADTVRVLEQHLRSLSLVRTAFAGSSKRQYHWSNAMDRYRVAVLTPDTVFPRMSFPVNKTLGNFLTSAEWCVHIIHFRKTAEKAPVNEVLAIVEKLGKSVDPVRVPWARAYHSHKGLKLCKKLTTSLKDYDFGQ